MILDIIVKKTDDGFTAEIPSIKGCENWAENEEAVLNKIIELASFYLSIKTDKFKLDKASAKSNVSSYKLVFDKN